MFKDVISIYLQRKKDLKLTENQIKTLTQIKNHRHLMLRTGRSDTFLEPCNTYYTSCLGCDLTNLLFGLPDLYSQAMQSAYLEAKNQDNFQLLTYSYYLDFNIVKQEYAKLINEGYSYEKIYELLRERFQLKDNMTLKRKRK